MTRPITLAAAVLVTGCAGGPGGSSVEPPALAYGVPNPSTVTYEVTETVLQEVDVMGNTQSMGGDQTMTISASFAESVNGVRVTMEMLDVDAEVRTIGGSMNATEADIDGALIVELTRTGDVVVESTPEVTGTGADIFQFVAMANGFFPQLPGTGVETGSTWTGTRSYDAEEGGGFIEATSTAEYTAVGDTTVAGRSLLKITWTGTTAMAIAANQEGVDLNISAELDGEGHYLWDLTAGLMVEAFGTAEGFGSVDVSMLPDPIPVAISSETRVEMVGN